MTGRMWVPEAPLPTWEDALAHAEVLRERGVDVRVDERLKSIDIRNRNGILRNPDDYINGKLHDPDDGTPALQRFYPDRSPEWIGHYTNGELVSEERFPPPIGEA